MNALFSPISPYFPFFFSGGLPFSDSENDSLFTSLQGTVVGIFTLLPS